ncbi:hypothetical protein CHLNCDRAFT_143154 [Chlorella variabilis]|uniref:Uncharacterized protein n=1 Tax=Chlorella variabilis TaxID=554065 RepID=E1Z9K9_CHLVA|nr:hypothetical protein CHLNCDRAFT_143154 [Chlorella variabilis]EFN57796.1 hypothetical protein CHLNCDRAFT_143154 [Chlorella variabilis]|eukprot:XP_005849898.1 hypothetical protein CHLNCDRAFT_143154 [Chlorella variabilis]
MSERQSADMPPPNSQNELLRKAVVSLEKKLRESTERVATLQAQVAQRQQEVAELPAVRGRLAEALATRDALDQQVEQWQRTAAQARGEVEDARRQLERTQAAVQAAEAAQQRVAEQAAQLRTGGEALQLEEARARGQAEMLAQQVQQLEAANGSLRLDNQAHAGKLKAAYEREGELLAEVAELQAQLRREQAKQRGGDFCVGSAVAPTAAAMGSSSSSGNGQSSDCPAAAASGPCSLEQMHRGLFLAAAAELTRGFTAQADRKAGELEQRLAAMCGAVERLRRQQGELRADLGEAQARCGREAEMARELLATNLLLHETVAALMERGTTARQAAVKAALSLSGEHRELLVYQKALAAELQQVASSLAVAETGKQLALLRHHAQVQGELRGVAAQLEDRVLRLTALRQAGLV